MGLWGVLIIAVWWIGVRSDFFKCNYMPVSALYDKQLKQQWQMIDVQHRSTHQPATSGRQTRKVDRLGGDTLIWESQRTRINECRNGDLLCSGFNDRFPPSGQRLEDLPVRTKCSLRNKNSNGFSAEKSLHRFCEGANLGMGFWTRKSCLPIHEFSGKSPWRKRDGLCAIRKWGLQKV